MKTGVADLPLHYGSCPRWLFGRMKNLGRAVTETMIALAVLFIIIEIVVVALIIKKLNMKISKKRKR